MIFLPVKKVMNKQSSKRNDTMLIYYVAGGESHILTKQSETLIQIQRYVEMMPFLLFGNPWGYRFHELLETVSKALEK